MGNRFEIFEASVKHSKRGSSISELLYFLFLMQVFNLFRCTLFQGAQKWDTTKYNLRQRNLKKRPAQLNEKKINKIE